MSGRLNSYVEVYRAPSGEFSEMVDHLLADIPIEATPLRLTFFGRPSSNALYESRLGVLRQKVADHFGSKQPALSYVAQPALDAPLLMELYGYRLSEGERLSYGQAVGLTYVLLHTPYGHFLFAGGFRGDHLDAPFRQQAEQAFSHLEQCLREVGFPLAAIQRQWNYIERITAFEQADQRYQTFNNARSKCYASTVWSCGYPAATGIGTHLGGLLIDFDAALFTHPDAYATPLDNHLQVAAHAYSDGVLERASQGKSTPKFERAKRINMGSHCLTYISGTAAIRGEESLKGVGLARQLRVTMENIAELVGEGRLTYLRVYLKHPEDYAEAAHLLDSYQLRIPITYMWADVCREELLIEIEGFAEEFVQSTHS